MGNIIQVIRFSVIQEYKNTDITQNHRAGTIIDKQCQLISRHRSKRDNICYQARALQIEINSAKNYLGSEYKVGKFLARASILQNYEDNCH